uniref:Reverse transcriptase domain-containing protein n=1 Tax=Triticum urartu TaxID=4572 RepID=A0A8R7TU90_TRIUA
PIDLSSLEEQFSWAEIVSAIKRSPNNRSPGPDGFTNEFYKCFKETLKPDLLNFFSDFHANNADLSGVNSASIVLLPKKEISMEIKDFRPISLVHSLPKLATKFLTTRLQLWIPKLV